MYSLVGGSAGVSAGGTLSSFPSLVLVTVAVPLGGSAADFGSVDRVAVAGLSLWIVGSAAVEPVWLLPS